jgi:hypothetical protein
MSIPYKTHHLISTLGKRNPEIAEYLFREGRRIDQGCVSIGAKIHSLNPNDRSFDQLAGELGGTEAVFERNYFRNKEASFCFILPAFGNPEALITLLESLEHYTGSRIFGNKNIQIQICSPGRLSELRSALLGICFYLGSDVLRSYSVAQLETTFSVSGHYPRGKRIILYDAEGSFDSNFRWWSKDDFGQLIVLPRLPMQGRSDVLTATSRVDIMNINFFATLFSHIEYGGFWKDFGLRFENEVLTLLRLHNLPGIISAPWVVTDDSETMNDSVFFSAFQELISYAFDEEWRLRREKLFALWQKAPNARLGILEEFQGILSKYKQEMNVTAPKILPILS